ncbi:rust resistance kinase Lr10-like [Apium graveolens]|uniref:rust resistance kinase Lr10-like n=1 Tax=Apium graveolens TaxID=4045 RepID=UPI003D7A4579
MDYRALLYPLWITLVFSISKIVAEKAEVVGEECETKRCSHHGPEIRFPFWLKGRQPEHCGLPGFRVSCQKGKTLLELQYLANTSLQGNQLFLSKEVWVSWINYTSQELETRYVFHNNFKFDLKLVPTSTILLPAIAPHPEPVNKYNTTFFSCSSIVKTDLSINLPVLLTSLSGQTFPVYHLHDLTDTSEPSITSCIKVFNSSLPYTFLLEYWSTIKWSTPNCRKCEAKGQYCKMKNSTSSSSSITDHSTMCLTKGHGHQGSVEPIVGIIPGTTLMVLVLIVSVYYVIRTYRQKKYDELKVEMFLSDYQAKKPTRYSYADVKKITSNFSDKLGQGGYGSVYKGQITSDIIVAVKVLNSDPKADGEDFINEVGTIGRVYHVNVVRLVGYCADGCNRALVYEYQPNNSLEKFTYSGKNHQKNFLGWERMQEIALGIAKGIDYLHQGCTQQILHFDIKPHNILLDQNFNPKISDFGLAKLCSKDQSIVSMTMARGTIGYIAPEVFSRNFGKVSTKSDVYSFGMLILEMVGARNSNVEGNTSETYFPEWIFHHLEEGGELAIQTEKEEDLNIAKKLTIVGLWCIGWHPVDRPSMKHVVHILERQECPTMPPNPFASSNGRSFTNDLEVISESE